MVQLIYFECTQVLWMFGCCLGGILTLLKLSLSILNGGSLDAITVYQNLKLMFISKMGRLEDTDKKDCSSMLVL